ncbi:DUF7344 domain-containing protein [Natronococcus pandeyae]
MDSEIIHSDDRSGESISRTSIFEILSNDRRRYVLEYLEQTEDGTADLRELVDYVAIRETGLTLDEVNYNARKSVYTSLRQSHLPKLHDTGVITYNQTRGKAELNECADDIYTYLQTVSAKKAQPHWTYFRLAVLCFLGGIAVWLNIPIIEHISWSYLFMLSISAVFITSSIFIFFDIHT